MAIDAASLEGTEPLADASRIDLVRLASLLADIVPDASGTMSIARFKGGQSNPTLLASFSTGRKLVLRKKPDGILLPSAHAVDREFRVISALQGSDVPVPRAHALVEDESILGAMFYVMDYVHGRSFWDPSLPGHTPSERRAIFTEMRRVIGSVHATDYARLGLETFGKPGNYLARQVARWSRQYRASETETIAAMDRLIDWLPENLPPEQPPALLHGDFRLDNMIFHPTEPKVLALLDWELSTLGDPIADFAYHTLTWHLPAERFRGLADIDLDPLGIPREPFYRQGYFQASGRAPVDERSWNVYLAYSLFRVAAIRQGIMKRVLDGTSVSAQAREAGSLARTVAEYALRFAEQADTQ
ncbi:MAG: Aminoglycoside phosphotransferase [Rhizobium sp.]|nr:Aminoglycoside phosphotransferase [Rhizobium sp.]